MRASRERSASTAVQDTAKGVRFLLPYVKAVVCGTTGARGDAGRTIARALRGHQVNTNCPTDSIRKLALELLETPGCRSPQCTHGLHPSPTHLNAAGYSLCTSLTVLTASLCRRLVGVCRKRATGRELTNLRFSTSLGKAS